MKATFSCPYFIRALLNSGWWQWCGVLYLGFWSLGHESLFAKPLLISPALKPHWGVFSPTPWGRFPLQGSLDPVLLKTTGWVILQCSQNPQPSPGRDAISILFSFFLEGIIAQKAEKPALHEKGSVGFSLHVYLDVRKHWRWWGLCSVFLLPSFFFFFFGCTSIGLYDRSASTLLFFICFISEKFSKTNKKPPCIFLMPGIYIWRLCPTTELHSWPLEVLT